MSQRRPLRAAPTLNAAADQLASETIQTTAEQRQAARDRAYEIREALIDTQLFGPIIVGLGHTYSKLVCPQRNEQGLPRTLVVAEANGTLNVRHPYDGASDTIRPMLSFKPEDYKNKNIGEFVIAAIKELHNPAPKTEPIKAPAARKLDL